jgi:hypothetical protein
MHNIQNLLNQVGIIVKKNNEILDATGGRFNVFNVIGLASDEVRLHSALLAELLRPNGTHGLKDEFLKAFIKQLGIENFDCQSAKVEVEKSIGLVTDTDGGRIDLVISDKNGSAIIIENKIYAGDQNAQLIRYNEYAIKKHRDKYNILYLTLDGKVATDGSAKGVTYSQISYAEHILDWLERCLNLSVRQPLVRETINQYISLIKQLTGQTNSNKMKTELIDLLISNPGHIESAQEIIKAMNELANKVREKFLELLKDGVGEPILLKNNMLIEITNGEDGDGVFLGFRLLDTNKTQQNESNLGKQYSEILKNIHPQMYKNPWHIG